MNADIAENFSELHEPHWVVRGAFQMLVFALVAAEALLAFTVYHGWIWAAVQRRGAMSNPMTMLWAGLLVRPRKDRE